ncbi:ATP-binding protein [Actinoplanes sp. NBC_00393]|uniref:AlbA family DNA-binding domain-containing protein n=1 Tax=Actinoplanes sp. NBC_00393 TaxID=2975953 RepID=UPI002E212766
MQSLRNRRLESLFGGPINANLTFDQVRGLIPNASESPDLDFKRDTYPSGDRGKKDLCGDIGGMANAGGGVIVIGIEEDDQARAASYSPVDVSDSERQRLRQTLYGNLHPAPTFDVIPVEDPEHPGHGFLIIWVARSTAAPHAYSPQGSARYYPRRVGTEKIWLGEAEIAEAYRVRFAGLADQFARVATIEAELLPRLASEGIFVVITLVPDMPGEMTIDTAAFDAFQLGNASRQLSAFGIPMGGFMQSTVRRRRLVATSSPEISQPTTNKVCELHADGSGAFAKSVESVSRDDVQRQERFVDSDQLVMGIATGLRRLGRHARDTAGAGGLANMQATVWTRTPTKLMLVSSVGWPNEPVGRGFIEGNVTSDSVADLDDLAVDGPGLVAATWRLANGLFQDFGTPETMLVTREGGIRLPYWYRDVQAPIRQWAAEFGVEILTAQ